MIRKLLLVLAGSLIATVVGAAPLTLTVTKGEPAAAEIFNMGTARRPDGMTLTLSRQSLLLNGQPWTPVMGEFHYSRYPANEWRAELLKMKAGGIDIVATYVFWIHHEEVEGVWEWSGDKNLRDFVRTAGELGLKVIVRCGPWCHGEVRNGGLPDWIVARGPVWVRSQQSGALAERMGAHVDALEGYFGGFVPLRAEVVGVPLAILLAVFFVDRTVGLVLLLTMPLVPVFMMLVGWGAQAASQRQLQALTRMGGHFADRLRGLGLIRLYGRGE